MIIFMFSSIIGWLFIFERKSRIKWNKISFFEGRKAGDFSGGNLCAEMKAYARKKTFVRAKQDLCARKYLFVLCIIFVS